MTTNEKQAMNVAIAEEMGWKRCDCGQPDCKTWWPPVEDFRAHDFSFPPDYTSSLDACAEFERTLDSREMERYTSWLCLWITGGTAVPDILLPMTKIGNIACATSEQRCEAFCRLRKIGPWKD